MTLGSGQYSVLQLVTLLSGRAAASMVAMNERAVNWEDDRSGASVGLILHLDGQNVIMITIIINCMDSQSLSR